MAFTFCLYLIAFGICFGVGISIIIIVPQILYQIPYHLWCAVANADHRFPQVRDSRIFNNTRLATKLYKHWIFHKELDF